MRYKYSKQAGALQEGIKNVPQSAHPALPPPPPASMSRFSFAQSSYAPEQSILRDLDSEIAPLAAPELPAEHTIGRQMLTLNGNQAGRDLTPIYNRHFHMFFYTVEDGQRVLVIDKHGNMEVVDGPKRLWRLGKTITRMNHHVAHPGDFLIVQFRDGSQEHLTGPSHVWFDPRKHISIMREEALPISAKEAIVVYHSDESEQDISRRIVYGPASFVPKPGEWLHTFSWHGSTTAPDGSTQKVPNALVFQKLWMMPDQMYHDVHDVRTADDALLTIRLMIFFELRDIEKMLATTHDPIGDFINAAASDVIEFVSRHDFEEFKKNTEKLNMTDTYKQLTSRAAQCGYHLDKVVYRGYGAPANLQKMHDEAIESRTRLQLERATEQQAQDLEDAKLERTMQRVARQREDEAKGVTHELQITQERQQAWLQQEDAKKAFLRQQELAEAQQRDQIQRIMNAAQQEHLQQLSQLGVDLTKLLTQNRADQVIELRHDPHTSTSPHIHLPHDPSTQ